MTDQPIEVSPDTTLGPLAAAGRYILASGSAYALGKGWVTEQGLQVLTGLLGVLAPLVYGAWRQWHSKKTLIDAANDPANEGVKLKQQAV